MNNAIYNLTILIFLSQFKEFIQRDPVAILSKKDQ